MPKINPEILTWARETAGLTREDAARKLGFKDAQKRTAVERLSAYEDGWDDPSRSVLANMAKQYRRPLLAFYLSKIPRKGERGADFRTLPAERSVANDAMLDALIRDVQARQSIVRAVLEDDEETVPLSFIGSHKMPDGKMAILTSLKSLLGVNLEDYRSQRTASAAFALLRTAVEEAGVIVILKGNLGSYHTEIETEVFRGFSIADEIAPFIVINEYDAKSAWSFTLIHELVHLLLGQTGVSGARAENDTERFCDDVAGEFLLPGEERKDLEIDSAATIDDVLKQVSAFARARNLSRAMVAYKVYRAGEITYPTYDRITSYFRQQWLEDRSARREQQRDRSPSPYITRRHRIGNGLITLVKRLMAAGELSTNRAARVLGVKPTQVHRLIERGQ